MSRFMLAALLVAIMFPIPVKAQHTGDDDPPEKTTKFPGAFAARRGAKQDNLVREGGANPGSERAVARGLAWLAAEQRADGSWLFDGTAKEDPIAATGIALLTYLGVGETHTDARKYKDTVSKGIKFLVSKMDDTGKFAGKHTMYSHGIATLALCEAYGMTKDKDLRRPATKAVDYIQIAQSVDGSWGYSPGTRGDMSVTGWQVQALQAARFCEDIKIDDRVIKKANEFLDKISGGSRKATYGYTEPPGAPGTALTAEGLYCRRHFSNWGSANGGMAEGVEGLIKNGPKPGTKVKPTPLDNVYYWYYATQVVHDYGGKEWRDWNEGPLVDDRRMGGMRDWLVWLQINRDEENFGKDNNKIGSWDPDRGTVGTSAGRLGTTCFCILTLEVYYRYVPAEKK